MNSFAESEIKEIEKKFGSYEDLLAFRYANLCVKADPQSLLPVTVVVGATGQNIEEVADVFNMDEYHLAVVPKNQDLLFDIRQALFEAHPEFEVSQEQMDEDDPASAFLLCKMPDVNKERYDVLVEATKNLHDECKARLDEVLLDEKSGFAELMAEEPESLKEVADQLNEKHQEAEASIRDLRDKKLDEIADAYEKYLSEHSGQSQVEVSEEEENVGNRLVLQ